jgi:antitoxin ParD1/3/4
MARRTSRTVSLSPDFENFVVRQVNSGRYATASEVIRAALRLLQQQQRDLDQFNHPATATSRSTGHPRLEIDQKR